MTKKIKEDWIEDKIIYKLLDRNEKRAAATFKAMSKSEKMKFVILKILDSVFILLIILNLQ